MGHAVTSETALGRKATPLRKRLNLVLRRIESNPPSGVNTLRAADGSRLFGTRNSVSPLGYVGRRMHQFTLDHPDAEFHWANGHSATTFLRDLLRGGNGRNKQLAVLEKVLPILEKEFPRIERTVHSHSSGEILNMPPEARESESLPDPAPVAPMNGSLPADVQAIAVVVEALEALTEDQRKAVVNYVVLRFGITT